MAGAGGGSRGVAPRVGTRATRHCRLFLGRPAGAPLRHRASRSRGAAGARLSRAGVARRSRGVRDPPGGAHHGARAPGSARGASRERAPRARSRSVSSAHVRALRGGILPRPRQGGRTDGVPGDRPDPAGGVAEPRRLRPPARPARAAGAGHRAPRRRRPDSGRDRRARSRRRSARRSTCCRPAAMCRTSRRSTIFIACSTRFWPRNRRLRPPSGGRILPP